MVPATRRTDSASFALRRLLAGRERAGDGAEFSRRLEVGQARNQKQETGGTAHIRAHYQSATLVTGTFFAPTLTKAAKEFTRLSGLPVEVIPIVNERLGETITVSGLLMGDDVINQLRARELGEVIVLPRIMFDHPQGIALDDVSPLRIARAARSAGGAGRCDGRCARCVDGAQSRLLIKPTDEVHSA